MIALEVEQALGRWINFVGDPDAGELSYRHGDWRSAVPVHVGVADEERMLPIIICSALDGNWEADYPIAAFRGVATVEFRHSAFAAIQVPRPAEEALRLARVIEQALHRTDLMVELSEASMGRLHFSGFTAGIQHQVTIENKHWVNVWGLPLYVVQLDLSPSQEIDSCLTS